MASLFLASSLRLPLCPPRMAVLACVPVGVLFRIAFFFFSFGAPLCSSPSVLIARARSAPGGSTRAEYDRSARRTGAAPPFSSMCACGASNSTKLGNTWNARVLLRRGVPSKNVVCPERSARGRLQLPPAVVGRLPGEFLGSWLASRPFLDAAQDRPFAYSGANPDRMRTGCFGPPMRNPQTLANQMLQTAMYRAYPHRCKMRQPPRDESMELNTRPKWSKPDYISQHRTRLSQSHPMDGRHHRTVVRIRWSKSPQLCSKTPQIRPKLPSCGRHLSRLCVDELGPTPVDIAQMGPRRGRIVTPSPCATLRFRRSRAPARPGTIRIRTMCRKRSRRASAHRVSLASALASGCEGAARPPPHSWQRG